MNLSEMVAKQVTVFINENCESLSQDIEYLLEQARDSSRPHDERVRLYEQAEQTQQRIANKTYDYATDAHHPSQFYTFVTDVKRAIRAERQALQGKASNVRAASLRSKFESLR